jgi:hypothetical protein
MLIISLLAPGNQRKLTDNDISESAVFKSAGDIDYFKPMDGAPVEFGMAYGNTFNSDRNPWEIPQQFLGHNLIMLW